MLGDARDWNAACGVWHAQASMWDVPSAKDIAGLGTSVLHLLAAS